MRAPAHLHDLTFDTEVAAGPYPPQGFLPIAEGALGNGDCFGLYWPLGREGALPLVCEMFHDEGRMVYSHSSLDVFVHWLGINRALDEDAWDDDEWDPRAHDVDDADSPFRLVESAQGHVAAGEPAAAIPLLDAATAAFPDLQKGWAMLAGQHMRLRNAELAVRAARSAVLANWAFGVPEAGVLRILKSAHAGEDPVVAMAQQMGFAFGGARDNPDYALMQACIDRCWQIGDREAALRLSHNRCYVLAAETVSFQERERFDLPAWQLAFHEQCRLALGDDRQRMQ